MVKFKYNEKKTYFSNKKTLIDYLFYQQYTFKTHYFHKNVSGSTYTLEKYYRAFKNLQQLGPKLHNGYSIKKKNL